MADHETNTPVIDPPDRMGARHARALSSAVLADEDVRVSNWFKPGKVDLNNPAAVELALIYVFENMRTPRLEALGGIPVDTSERRRQVAAGIGDLFREVLNAGETDEEKVKKEQEEASKAQADRDKDNEDNESGKTSDVDLLANTTSDPRSRDEVLAQLAGLTGKREDATVQPTAATTNTPSTNNPPNVDKSADKPTSESGSKDRPVVKR